MINAEVITKGHGLLFPVPSGPDLNSCRFPRRFT